jgi:hypothetical protein
VQWRSLDVSRNGDHEGVPYLQQQQQQQNPPPPHLKEPFPSTLPYINVASFPFCSFTTLALAFLGKFHLLPQCAPPYTVCLNDKGCQVFFLFPESQVRAAPFQIKDYFIFQKCMFSCPWRLGRGRDQWPRSFSFLPQRAAFPFIDSVLRISGSVMVLNRIEVAHSYDSCILSVRKTARKKARWRKFVVANDIKCLRALGFASVRCTE